MAAPIVPILLLAGVGLALAGSKKEAKAAPATSAPLNAGAPPSEVLSRMAGALASGDPAVMRKEADKLKSEGWPLQAAELQRVAVELEQGKVAVGTLPSSSPNVTPLAKQPANAPASQVPGPGSKIVEPAEPSVGPLVVDSKSPGFVPPISVPATPATPPVVIKVEPPAVPGGVPTITAAPQLPQLPGLPSVTVGPGVVSPAVVTSVPAPLALTLDAIPDPAPGARLLKLTTPHMKGLDVGSLQRILKALGYGALLGKSGPAKDGVDNDFGSATDKAVRALQAADFKRFRDPRVKIDGQVGPITRRVIVRASKPTLQGELVARPASPLPGRIPAAVDLTPEDPQRQLCAALVVNLLECRRPGSEDRTLCRRFQMQEGVKPTGLYGPGTAIKVAEHGIVPPWPRYWTKTGRAATRKRYREYLLAKAAQDPARADDWQGAAVAGD